MDCVRLALVNLYKGSPKQAHQNRFFFAFLQFILITETPFINCPRHLREQNESFFALTSIFARPESLLARHIALRSHGNACYAGYQSSISGSLLLLTHLKVTIHNASEAISAEFLPFTKNTCATLRVEVARASKIWSWIFNACFTQITS